MDIEFVQNTGIVTILTPSTSTTPVLSMYNTWCDELGVTKDTLGIADFTNRDDGVAQQILDKSINNVDSEIGVGISSEGGFEIVNPSRILDARKYINIPNVDRLCLSNYLGNRFILSYHSNGIGDSIHVFYGQKTTNALIWYTKSSVQESAIRINFGKNFIVAIKDIGGITIPVYANELDGNVFIKQTMLATQKRSDNNITVITGSYFYGNFVGKVIDENGNPAKRLVRGHVRATGKIIGETMSADDGTFQLPTNSKEECYIVAFDDDIAPSLNALIYDRVKFT